ncbi:MAG TPA: hypothetical protein VHM67_11420 [Gemmatimonadaceae bacterium]|nr:hypothetical protein [Gemmatimonadaceae bacterium]
MNRIRFWLGIAVGIVFILSSGAHSLLGWKRLSAALVATRAPTDLIAGLGVGWHFAGAAMLVFGCIVIWLFLARRRRQVSLRPAQLIAVLYIVFGSWAFVISNMNPFFLIFIVPGMLLAVAAWGDEPAAG